MELKFINLHVFDYSKITSIHRYVEILLLYIKNSLQRSTSESYSAISPETSNSSPDTAAAS